MNIIKTGFIQFLDLVKLKGDIESTEAVFNISKDNIKLITKTANNVVALKGKLKGDFEDIGEIGIGNLGLLRNLINSFEAEELQLTKTKNKLVFNSPNDKVEIHFSVTKPEYIKVKLNDDNFEELVKAGKGNECTLSSEIIQKIVSFSNTIKATHIILTGDKNTIELQLDEMDNKILAQFEVPERIQPFRIKFQASYLLNLLVNLKEAAVLSIHTNKPMYLKIENGAYEIEYMIAPIELKNVK